MSESCRLPSYGLKRPRVVQYRRFSFVRIRDGTYEKKEKSRFMEKRLLNFGYFCFRNGICELSYICAVQNCFVLCFAVKFCSEKNVLTKEFFSAAVSFQPARCFPLPASPALFSSLTAFGAFQIGRGFSPVWRRVGFSIYDCFLCSGDTFLLRHYGKMPL